MSIAEAVADLIKKIVQKIGWRGVSGEGTGDFEARYSAFQGLLEQNNRALELMADLEEKRSGEYLFDRQYTESRLAALSSGVDSIIESLNALSRNRYHQLPAIHAGIQNKIKDAITHKRQIPPSDFCIPVHALGSDMVLAAGGKMANLGEIRNRLGLPVPDGFSITTRAFKRFLDHNVLAGKIAARLSATDSIALETINSMSSAVQDMIRGAEVPEDVQSAVRDALARLRCEGDAPLMTAVRSSAVLEDGAFSFAGQYASFLNVPEEMVLERYKDVLASLFSPRAIFYYKTKQFCEDDLIMAVGVLRMVPAAAGGVLYTKDPNDPDADRAQINAVFGLGLAAVDGTVHPETCIVSLADGVVRERTMAGHGSMYVCSPGGGIASVPVPPERAGFPCLSQQNIQELSRMGAMLEQHYGGPQDIEWAVDGSGRIIILQCRPLRVAKPAAVEKSVPRRIEGRRILLDSGVIACKGIGFGQAFVLKSEDDLTAFPQGAVLIARHTSTRFVTVMTRAAAIVTDVGGVAGHMASLAREYGIPTIVDTGAATAAISSGREITVDAVNCTVYDGLVEELRPYTKRKKDPFKDTHLFLTLERALQWVVPLHLTDPDAEDFRPEACRTVHDITRFSHEKAMAEMFSIGDAYDGRSRTITLSAGIPVRAHLYDISGGVKRGLRVATSADILSIPFSAFLRGMKGMRWPEPPPADVKGFLGMIAHTAEMSEEDLRRTAEKSFAVVSANYMNFSIRLGYHFSQVEAYVGENLNDNYIKFFFSGGGAVRDRRLRRVRLIKEILASLDFHITLSDDVVRAELLKYRRPALEARLEVMGRLTAYTKQLDMTLFNDPITDWYIEEFISEHVEPRKDLRPEISASP